MRDAKRMPLELRGLMVQVSRIDGRFGAAGGGDRGQLGVAAVPAGGGGVVVRVYPAAAGGDGDSPS